MITNIIRFTLTSAIVIIIFTVALRVRGEPDNRLKVESMLGKYNGVIQVINVNAVLHPYQTEIFAVNKLENTVSLSAYCVDCDVKDLKRDNCKITEVTEKITFVCKGPSSDEVYTFNGMRLKATGFGNKYPYAINVTKID
jgi:hypothetical protein